MPIINSLTLDQILGKARINVQREHFGRHLELATMAAKDEARMLEESHYHEDGWVAMDANGSWFVYGTKPDCYLAEGLWYSEGEEPFPLFLVPRMDVDWKLTLAEFGRP